MQLKAGARMFYKPSIEWTMVLPIRHILGRVPLMRLYLEGSVQPTIPHSLAGDKAAYFEYGCADRAGRDGIGSGSRLFEINVHLWQYGRPQPRTMSVQERLGAQSGAHDSDNRKAQRNESTKQEVKAACGGDLTAPPIETWYRYE